MDRSVREEEESVWIDVEEKKSRVYVRDKVRRRVLLSPTMSSAASTTSFPNDSVAFRAPRDDVVCSWLHHNTVHKER